MASSADGSHLVAIFGGTLQVSSDYGATWSPREPPRSWAGVASSADGVRLAAVPSYGYIYTSPDPAHVPHQTLSGDSNSAVEVQYIGADTFRVLSHEGTLAFTFY